MGLLRNPWAASKVQEQEKGKIDFIRAEKIKTFKKWWIWDKGKKRNKLWRGTTKKRHDYHKAV